MISCHELRALTDQDSVLPHPYNTSQTSSICLITADPQSTYTTLLESPDFPASLRQRVTKVISISNLKKQHSTFEARRQLFASYDTFLADDRIVTYLPGLLGKVFYKGGTKRPIPVSIAASRDRGADGKRIKLDPASGRAEKQKHKDESKERGAASPEAVAKEIERALKCALVHLAPGVSTAVKVARAGMTAQEVAENVEALTNSLVDRFVTGKWRNVRAIHIKGPETMAFPIWMANELWEDEADVLEEKKKFGKKNAPKLVEQGEDEDAQMIDGAAINGKKRKAEETKKPTVAKHAKKKRKVELEGRMAAETISRKDSLKKQKAAALSNVA